MPAVPTLPRRSQVLSAARAAGMSIAAVYPIRYPRALLRAHGLLPVEVWGPPGTDTTAADAHVQSYVCSIVRCGLGFLLNGGLEGVDLLMVPHACDSLQGLGSLLLDLERPRQPVVPLYLPRGEGPDAVRYLAAELRVAAGRIAEATGQQPSDSELMQAVLREEAADACFSELLLARPQLPWSDHDFYRVLRSREYLPAEDFEALVRPLLGASGGRPEGVPIVLSGIVPEPMEVLEVIHDAGGYVAADDLASCGRRAYPAGRSHDPYQRMAERLQGAPADCMRGDPVSARVAHLRSLVARTGARAVVFFEPSFCEPELFYLPLQRKALHADGLRTLSLEVHVGEPLSQQAVTRLEALMETVS